MGTLYKQKIYLYLHLALFMLFMTMSASNVVFKKVFSDYFLLEIVMILLVSTPIFLFKKNIFSIIYSVLIFTYWCIAYVLTLMLDYNSGDIFSLKYINLAKELMQVSTPSFINVFYVLLLVAFVVSYLATLIYFILATKKSRIKKYKPTKYITLYLTFASLFLIFTGGKYLCYNKIESDYKNNDLYKGMSASEIIHFTSNRYKKSAFEKFGLVNMYFSEISEMIDHDTQRGKKEIDAYLNSNNATPDTNDYTGLLKDMNVVTIMVESAQSYIVNETLTPNLYSLQQNGLVFNNNHSKNKTNISEIIGMLGSSYEHTISSGYKVDYSLAAKLNKEGYETAFFHDNDSSFYDRDNVAKELGYKNGYYHKEYSNEPVQFKGNMPYDTTFVENVIDKMVPKDKKFYSFWTTIASHGPYNSNDESIKKYTEKGYYAKLEEAKANNLWVNPIDRGMPRYGWIDIKEEERETLRKQFEHYQVEIMNFDDSLGMLINRLKENNQYDNTIFVIYGDHDAYYASNKLRPIKYYLYGCMDMEEYPAQYEALMIISNPKLKALYESKNGNNAVNMFTSPYIIVPTLLDLLGVNYDSRYYINKSLFNSNGLDNLFYSYELKSTFTDKVFDIDYMNTKYKASDVDAAYLEEFYAHELELIKKIDIINKMYRFQYFG